MLPVCRGICAGGGEVVQMHDVAHDGLERAAVLRACGNALTDHMHEQDACILLGGLGQHCLCMHLSLLTGE